MTIETGRRRPHRWAESRGAERRAEALVAAYIHELSPRHRAEREAMRPSPTPAGFGPSDRAMEAFAWGAGRTQRTVR
jgi:hypothetical protein